MAGVVREGQDVAFELLEDTVEASRLFGRRFAEPPLHLRPCGESARRPGLLGGEHIYQRIDRSVAHRSHGFGIEPERISVHKLPQESSFVGGASACLLHRCPGNHTKTTKCCPPPHGRSRGGISFSINERERCWIIFLEDVSGGTISISRWQNESAARR